MRNQMKKWIALLLVSAMFLLSACSSAPVSSGGDPESSLTESSEELSGGRVLPIKLRYTQEDTEKEIAFSWSENACSFELDGGTYQFTYDPKKRSLTFVRNVNGEESRMEDFFVFDEEGRVLSMTVDKRTVFSLSYEDEKVIADYVSESETAEPIDVFVDRTGRKMAMPPFDDPERLIGYTEYGDLSEGEGQIIYTYTYDEYGNIEKILHELNGASTTFEKGEQAMTESWQRVPVKVAHVFCGANAAWAMLAMDAM